MAENTETRFLTIRETAHRLCVSPATIYRRVHAGEIPAVRVGEASGPIRIVEREFEEWLYSDPGEAA
jgi:excisionase family DNA binding protein